MALKGQVGRESTLRGVAKLDVGSVENTYRYKSVFFGYQLAQL